MRFEKAYTFVSEFSVQLLRQQVTSAIARHMAGYIEAMPEEEFLAALGTDGMVDRLEAELYEKVPREKLDEWARVASPYVSCFSEEDIGTIYLKLLGRLSADRARALDRHREWMLGQMEEAWRRLLSALGEEWNDA